MTDPIIEVLRDRRRLEGFSQRDLARHLGTQQSAISEWETGRVAPSVASLQAWASALGLDLQIRLVRKRS